MFKWVYWISFLSKILNVYVSRKLFNFKRMILKTACWFNLSQTKHCFNNIDPFSRSQLRRKKEEKGLLVLLLILILNKIKSRLNDWFLLNIN